MERVLIVFVLATLLSMPLSAEDLGGETYPVSTVEENESTQEVNETMQPGDNTRDSTPSQERNARDGMQRYWWSQDGTRVAGILNGNNFAEVGYSIVDLYEAEEIPDDSTLRRGNYDTIEHLVGLTPIPSGETSVTVLDGRQAKSALTSYTGHSYSHALQAAHSNVRGIRQGILRHVDDINKTIGSGGASLEKSSDPGLSSPLFGPGAERRFWVGGISQWENVKNGDEGLPGYKYSGNGVLTGYDQTYGSLSVGAALGYAGGKFKDKSALENDSRIDSYSANVYATYNPGTNLRAMAIAGYGYSDTSLRKRRAGVGRDDDGNMVAVEGWERAKYGVDTFSLGGRVGYETEFKDKITLGVTGGVFYQHSRAANFVATFAPDSGVGASSINVGSLRTHSLSLPIDITADYLLHSTCDSSLTVSANVGYGFEFNNDGATGTLVYGGIEGASRVDFAGRSPGRNSANFGLGVAYENDRLDLTARHDIYLRSDYVGQRFTGNVGLKF